MLTAMIVHVTTAVRLGLAPNTVLRGAAGLSRAANAVHALLPDGRLTQAVRAGVATAPDTGNPRFPVGVPVAGGRAFLPRLAGLVARCGHGSTVA